jgi:hypothetical protein
MQLKNLVSLRILSIVSCSLLQQLLSCYYHLYLNSTLKMDKKTEALTRLQHEVEP